MYANIVGSCFNLPHAFAHPIPMRNFRCRKPTSIYSGFFIGATGPRLVSYAKVRSRSAGRMAKFQECLPPTMDKWRCVLRMSCSSVRCLIRQSPHGRNRTFTVSGVAATHYRPTWGGVVCLSCRRGGIPIIALREKRLYS